jgi:hypothetical protein
LAGAILKLNWNVLTGFAALFVIAYAAVACVKFVSYQEEHSHERYDVAHHSDPATKRDLEVCIKAQPSGIIKLFACVIEAAQSDQVTKKDKYDLKAQQEMSEWAYGMLWATVFTIFVGIMGIIFVGLTLRETRRIGQAQVRAYLVCPKGNFISYEKHLSVYISIKNVGQSPAKSIRVTAKISHRENSENGISSGESLSQCISIMSVPSSATSEAHIHWNATPVGGSFDFPQIFQGMDSINVDGVIEWTDVFDHSQSETFRLRGMGSVSEKVTNKSFGLRGKLRPITRVYQST